MEYLVQFQINVFGLLLLMVLFLFVKSSKIKTFGKQLILLLVYSTAFAIIMEPLTWIFDGMMFFGAYFLEYSTNFILFLLGPIVGGFIMSYIDFRIFKDPFRIKRLFYYQHASVFTLVILLINFVTPIYFQVNP